MTIPIRLTTTGATTWNAPASPALDPEAEEDLQLLIDADPAFTLRFGDSSVATVVVEPGEDLRRLRLTAVRAPASAGSGPRLG